MTYVPRAIVEAELVLQQMVRISREAVAQRGSCTDEERIAWINDLRALVASGRAEPDQIERLELVEYILERARRRMASA
jgi:hypothetical protein